MLLLLIYSFLATLNIVREYGMSQCLYLLERVCILFFTALVSVIGLEDVVRKADLAGGSTHKPFNFWIACALIYLLITSVSNRVQRALEERYNIGFQESEA